jgi:DNA-binding transcriptional regulator YhcF (GntR family)
MILTLELRAPEPPYEQIRQQLARGIVDRQLVSGTRLPTVRKLAADLGLAANTVARAYRELEQAGLVETRGRGGTFVAARGDRQRDEATRAAREYAALIRRLGLDDREAVSLVNAALQAQAPPPRVPAGAAGDAPRSGSTPPG